eukprot:11228346-Lingulodinium_polyedra.AAC.1
MARLCHMTSLALQHATADQGSASQVLCASSLAIWAQAHIQIPWLPALATWPIMPSSGSSSAQGTTPRKTSSARAERAAVKQLASSLQANQACSQKADRDYIMDRLDNADKDLCGSLASLMRKGILRMAVEQVLKKQDLSKGKELPPSQLHFKSLREPALDAILQKMEPGRFPKDVPIKLNRIFKIGLVTFALNVSSKEFLPSLSPALRFQNVLAEYCAIRYRKMGCRLANFNPKDPKTYTYLSMDGNIIKLNFQVEGEDVSLQLDMLTHMSTTDWAITYNTSQDATLKSSSECVTIKLLEKFTQADLSFGPKESLDWHIPVDEWPTAMQTAMASAQADHVATPPAKRPRGGSGKARVSRG